MATSLSLDSIREAADKEYGGLTVELGDGKTVELKNPLRLTKDERKQFENLTSSENSKDLSTDEVFEGIWSILAGKAGAKALNDALGDDAALHATLLKQVTSGVELGEASPSQD